MDFYAKAERLSDKDFKQIIGVKKVTFDAMVKILKEAYARKPKKWRGGRKKKLTMENQLLMTLEPVQYLFMCGCSSIILSLTRKKSVGILTYCKDF